MTTLNKKAFGGLVFLEIILGLVLFLVAGSLNYWQAWVYLALFFLSAAGITLDLAKRDPALLQRRVSAGPGAEKEMTQKIIQTIAQFAFLAIFLVAALDHRFGWSEVAIYFVIVADALVVGGFVIVFLVFKQNSFTSATIEVTREQPLISTGLYGVVRHPMYSGALILLIGTPIALGSWWGLLTIMPMAFVLVWRLIAEERYLSKHLAGYTEYCQHVRSRLIPGIF